jgi:hypothetical protein
MVVVEKLFFNPTRNKTGIYGLLLMNAIFLHPYFIQNRVQTEVNLGDLFWGAEPRRLLSTHFIIHSFIHTTHFGVGRSR